MFPIFLLLGFRGYLRDRYRGVAIKVMKVAVAGSIVAWCGGALF